MRKRVAYSLAIVRLILVPVIFLAIYYLFVMGQIVDRIVNVDAPAAKLAEQASLEILEARRAARNYLLFLDPEYLRANQESTMKVRQILAHIRDLEPDENVLVQKAQDAVNQYQRLFTSATSTMAQRRQEPVKQIREAAMAYERDLDELVQEAKHKRRAELIQELRIRVDSFDARITEAIQGANPALREVTPDLRASSQEALQLISGLELENWRRVQMDHEKARHLIRRAEWALSIVSAFALLFSVWAGIILPRQVVQPLVSLRQAVDHAATGNYEIEFEVHGDGEVVELAKSIQHLTSLLRKQPHDREKLEMRQS